MAPVRLYVGGLPPDVSEEQLRARFTPFGAVSSCSLAPPKVYGGASFPRNFGHVELEPKDEAALRRCISAYNGCRWKGALLKCALARPHYLERLRQPEQEKEVLVGALVGGHAGARPGACAGGGSARLFAQGGCCWGTLRSNAGLWQRCRSKRCPAPALPTCQGAPMFRWAAGACPMCHGKLECRPPQTACLQPALDCG